MILQKNTVAITSLIVAVIMSIVISSLVPVSAVNVSSSGLGFYYSTAYHMPNSDSSTYGVPFSIVDDSPIDGSYPVVDVVQSSVTQTLGSTDNTTHFNLSAYSPRVQNWDDTIDSLTVGNIYFHFYYSFHQPVFQSVIFDFPTYPQYSLSSNNTLTPSNAEAVDLSRLGISLTDRSTGQVYEPDPSEYSIIRYSAYGIAVRLDTFLNFSGNWYLNFTFDIHPTFTDVDPSNCYFNYGCTVNNNIMYIDNTTTDQQILDTLGHINDNIDSSTSTLQQAIEDLGGTVEKVGSDISSSISDAESNLEDFLSTPSSDQQDKIDCMQSEQESLDKAFDSLDDALKTPDIPDNIVTSNPYQNDVESFGDFMSSLVYGQSIPVILTVVGTLMLAALVLFGL